MSAENEAVEQQVMSVLESYAKALHDKNLDSLAEHYDEGVRVFDVGSQSVGFEKLRESWEICFPYFQNPIGTQRKEVQITAGEELAVVSFFSRLTGMESEHPSAKSWFRTTVCLRKIDGQWKIIHDHVSLPVDCMAEKPVYL